jgi:hypothetical protein
MKQQPSTGCQLMRQVPPSISPNKLCKYTQNGTLNWLKDELTFYPDES